MIPLEQLLHRLQWDPRFAGGSVEIGYIDRVRQALVRVPFAQVRLTRGHHFSFDVLAEDGSERQVPFHRVRAVWRDGEMIWERPQDGACARC
jgi:uncharacterized protein (UPF0248 family)